MTRTKLTLLAHLRAAFGTTDRVERLEQELRVVADYHVSLADRMRALLGGEACDAPNALITRAGAKHLAETHDRNAADSTAMADVIRRALHDDLEDHQ
jgi:hypothetical protein